PNHPSGELIIAVGLHATDATTRRMASEIQSEGRVTRNLIRPVRIRPKCSGVCAKIAAGPVERGRNNGRGLVDEGRPRELSSIGRTAENRGHSKPREKQSSHATPTPHSA